jgi:Late competence development protein ComFB
MPFENIKNYQEQLVFERIKALAANYASISDDQLDDVACIALNTLRPRYVRRLADLHRFMTDDQRRTYDIEAGTAALAAFEYVLFERGSIESGKP